MGSRTKKRKHQTQRKRETIKDVLAILNIISLLVKIIQSLFKN